MLSGRPQASTIVHKWARGCEDAGQWASEPRQWLPAAGIRLTWRVRKINIWEVLTKFIMTIDEPLPWKRPEARTALGAAPNPARQERDIWEVLSKFILTSDETNSIEEDRSALGSARRPASFLIFKYERHEATVTCARCCSSRF
jgi:hypothetical protein